MSEQDLSEEQQQQEEQQEQQKEQQEEQQEKQQEEQQEEQKPEHDIVIENYSQKQSVLKERSYQIPEADVFCIRWSPDDQLIATGNYEGDVNIYDCRKDKIIHTLRTSPEDETPITCFRWRPGFNYRAKKVLLAANSDGSVSQWHAQSGKLLFKFFEQDNQVLACDYMPRGTSFCTAGKDFRVRVYDENTKQKIQIMEPNTWNAMGHSNRIFSVKYYDDNTIISGGWDSNIFIWDVRAQKSVGNLYGPSISGDSVDVKDNLVVTGQYRNKEQLQFWDLRTLQSLDTKTLEDYNLYCYAAQFSKFGSGLAMGSSGVNSVQILDKSHEVVGKCTNLTKGCYALDYANNSDKIAFYGGEDRCFIIQV